MRPIFFSFLGATRLAQPLLSPYFTRSTSFPNATLTVAHFFSLTFGWVFFLKREEDSLACSLFEKKTQPKVSEKKGQPVRVSFGNKLLLTELVL